MFTLESSRLFQELPVGELSHLREVTQELHFDPQQVIFHEGDPGDGIYLIKEGQVQISAGVGHGLTRILTELGCGELLGEMAVLDNDPRSATAIAMKPTTAYFIARRDLDDMIGRTPSLAIGLVREVSQRLRVFNQQYIREALEGERLALVGRFASSIVHDLKNPLNVIGSFADMSISPNATSESRLFCKNRIWNQIERIDNMASELLEFARGGQAAGVLSQVDYASFIHQVFEEVQREASIKSVTIKLEAEPPPVMVRINPLRLARVFYNLVGNATDAMPAGGMIVFRFRSSAEELVTEVQDSGSGIAPEIADRLFHAFATHGKASGTGLGLSICRKIIEDHHGKISARNAPQGGALFAFTLPVAPAI